MKRRTLLRLVSASPLLTLPILSTEADAASEIPKGLMFEPGQELGQNDLKIFLVDGRGDASDSAKVTYSLHAVDRWTEESCVVGPAEREPVRVTKGEFYAALAVPAGARGLYFIRWRFPLAEGEGSLEQHFWVRGSSESAG
jgi:hypothetical protein